LIIVAFLNQRSFTDSGRVVVSSLSHYYAASLYKDILALFPNRIFVLRDVCVVALGDILLGALGLLLLLNLLLLLLPHNTNYSRSILYTIREVYSCILRQDLEKRSIPLSFLTSSFSGAPTSLWLYTI
jgi:hypothetical protein